MVTGRHVDTPEEHDAGKMITYMLYINQARVYRARSQVFILALR